MNEILVYSDRYVTSMLSEPNKKSKKPKEIMPKNLNNSCFVSFIFSLCQASEQSINYETTFFNQFSINDFIRFLLHSHRIRLRLSGHSGMNLKEIFAAPSISIDFCFLIHLETFSGTFLISRRDMLSIKQTHKQCCRADKVNSPECDSVFCSLKD